MKIKNMELAISALEKTTRFSRYFRDVPFVMLRAITSLRTAFYIKRHRHVISSESI
jgi:hypothetical protein